MLVQEALLTTAGFGGISQAKSVDYQLMLFAHISLNVHYVLIHLLVQNIIYLEHLMHCWFTHICID